MAILQKGYHDFHGYIDFINYCFGMDGRSRAFDSLLPKLYADGRSSSDDTYFALENGKLIGTVLAHPLTFKIGKKTIKARGIGSVATHPRHRGEGFMKELMKKALDDMNKDGIALSVLGGRRHRYAHFGYEKCDGMTYYALTQKTLSYRAVSTEGYAMKRIEKDDHALLDKLHTAMHARPYHTVRPRQDLYDILISWRSVPYAFFKDDTLVGWAIHYVGKAQLSEFEYLDESAVPAMLALSCARLGSLSVAVPAYDDTKASLIDPFAETVTSESNECFLVLDWKAVLTATLLEKASITPLVNGSLTVKIEGLYQTVTLTLSVENGQIGVRDSQDPPDIVLSQCDAELFFFRNHAANRRLINPEAASWLPLPLFIHESDNV